MKRKSMLQKVKDGYNSGSYCSFYRNRLTLNSFESSFFNGFMEAVGSGARILDIGSGPGTPYDLFLVKSGAELVGIDVSEKHVSMARESVPSAEYLLGDFLSHPFPKEGFDGAVCLYTLFHMPRSRHAAVIKKIARLLRPNGKLLITVGTEDVPYKQRADFCGAEMAWSYFDVETNLTMIAQNGFTVLQSLNEKDHGSGEKHLWVLATKSSS